jgi:hypothetical protein
MITLYKNTWRRTLRWPIAPGVVALIASGSMFEIDDADLDADPGLRGALRALIAERMVAAVDEEDDVQRVLH